MNGSFVALEEMVHFAPWDQFFYFSFPSYDHFLWGHRLSETAHALQARRLDKNDHRQFSIHLGEIAPFPLAFLGSVVNKIFI